MSYPFYMLHVEGRDRPRVEHFLLLDALDEGERLARLPENLGRKVYLLAPIKCAVAQVIPVCWADTGRVL